MEKMELTSGIRTLPVIVDGWDTGRTVNFNPADQEFAEELYALVYQIGQIHKEKNALREAQSDMLKRFEINRAEDSEMRAAVDTVFGDGFSNDVFKTRLFAVAEDGLTVVENFLLVLMDEMDETATKAIAKRDAKIKKYTEKYRKYR